MTAVRALAAAALGAAFACALAFASAAPYAAEPGGDAAIRLSWRAHGEPVEECRRPSAEEQAGLPVHMRRSQICERRLAPFRLEVALDGEPAIDAQVLPRGARHDRPAYVLHELRTAPGGHRIQVRFGPEGEPAAAQALDAAVELAPREVLLVTLDDAGRLALRRH